MFVAFKRGGGETKQFRTHVQTRPRRPEFRLSNYRLTVNAMEVYRTYERTEDRTENQPSGVSRINKLPNKTQHWRYSFFCLNTVTLTVRYKYGRNNDCFKKKKIYRMMRDDRTSREGFRCLSLLATTDAYRLSCCARAYTDNDGGGRRPLKPPWFTRNEKIPKTRSLRVRRPCRIFTADSSFRSVNYRRAKQQIRKRSQ